MRETELQNHLNKWPQSAEKVGVHLYEEQGFHIYIKQELSDGPTYTQECSRIY